PVYVTDVLGGGTELAGALISLAAVASMLSMPVAGVLGDRFGYRLVAVIGSAVATAAMVLLVSVPTVWGAGLSRLLFGLGGSAAVTLLMAWLVTMA
ncbi:MFS transporter, partial [Acinetobacter baumannii]